MLFQIPSLYVNMIVSFLQLLIQLLLAAATMLLAIVLPPNWTKQTSRCAFWVFVLTLCYGGICAVLRFGFQMADTDIAWIGMLEDVSLVASVIFRAFAFYFLYHALEIEKKAADFPAKIRSRLLLFPILGMVSSIVFLEVKIVTGTFSPILLLDLVPFIALLLIRGSILSGKFYQTVKTAAIGAGIVIVIGIVCAWILPLFGGGNTCDVPGCTNRSSHWGKYGGYVFVCDEHEDVRYYIDEEDGSVNFYLGSD